MQQQEKIFVAEESAETVPGILWNQLAGHPCLPDQFRILRTDDADGVFPAHFRPVPVYIAMIRAAILFQMSAADINSHLPETFPDRDHGNQIGPQK
jgi:hypothetical protein